eukprot:COSAG02_NODE_10499_length_1928_cov_1.572991_2_plen_100_part_00
MGISSIIYRMSSRLAVVWTPIDSHVAIRVCTPAGDAGTANATRDLDETCITKFLAPGVPNLPARPMLIIYTISDDGCCVIDLLAHAPIRAHCLDDETVV